MKTVYVQMRDLLPEKGRNIPYWNSIDNIGHLRDGKLNYDSSPGYFDQDTGEELECICFFC